MVLVGKTTLEPGQHVQDPGALTMTGKHQNPSRCPLTGGPRNRMRNHMMRQLEEGITSFDRESWAKNQKARFRISRIIYRNSAKLSRHPATLDSITDLTSAGNDKKWFGEELSQIMLRLFLGKQDRPVLAGKAASCAWASRGRKEGKVGRECGRCDKRTATGATLSYYRLLGLDGALRIILKIYLAYNFYICQIFYNQRKKKKMPLFKCTEFKYLSTCKYVWKSMSPLLSTVPGIQQVLNVCDRWPVAWMREGDSGF